MRIFAAVLLAAMLGACATTASDAPPSAPVEGDEFQIRATVLAVYNVLSGPAGRRDWDRFEALFAPGARIVTIGADGVPSTATPKEYAAAMTPAFNAAAWFQRPAETRVQHEGSVAQVWSAYELRDAASQEQPSGRGVASFAFVRIGGEWKVESLISQSVAR
ncbi:MAG TPA: DUF4440 domain-containing protein [Thermoanaerobaculia bacterium]|nr:DUF4440 domain-containing protein [Thermoanaerobaculia bacterium]